MGAPPNRKIPLVFAADAMMDDAAAEAAELGGQEGAQPQPDLPESGAQPALAPELGPPTNQPVEPETRADKRIRQLLTERQEAIRERDEQREKWARLEERQKQREEAQEAAQRTAQQQQEATQRPDPAIDPVGAQLYDLAKQNQELLTWKQQQERQFTQLQQGLQVDRQTQDFNNWIVAEAQNFSRAQPDYADAARHAAEWRANWWQELGLPPEQARQMVMHESQLLAQISRQSGKPFAPVIYKLAQSVGYRSTSDAGAANGNGAQTTGDRRIPEWAPAAVTNAARLLQAQRGQAMQGLGRAPSAGEEGKSRYRDMSAADVSAVPDNVWQRDWANPVLRPDMEYVLKRLDGLTEHDDISYRGRDGR